MQILARKRVLRRGIEHRETKNIHISIALVVVIIRDMIYTYFTFLFLPVNLEGFSLGSLSVNLPIEAVDLCATARALSK